MPDHEYEVSAWANGGGYVPQRLQRINLPEGGTAQLTLILRKKPKPPQVGKPVPSFSVKTLDGRELSLVGLHGKTVLIHSCNATFGFQELPSLKAVHDLFGNDERFAMIGLWLVNDPTDAEDLIKANGLKWPQAVLRDRGQDPIVMDYGAWPPPKSFLIGPEGRLIAQDLQGDPLQKAVAEVLGRR